MQFPSTNPTPEEGKMASIATTHVDATVDHVMALASENSRRGEMVSSAVLCTGEAGQAMREGAPKIALACCLRSLMYSVGVFDPAYREAVRWVQDAGFRVIRNSVVLDA